MRRQLTVLGLASLLLTGCGSTTGERAATAGLTGLAAGGLAGGPVGALVGGGIGATVGALAPESGVTMGKKAANMVLPNEFKGPAVAEQGGEATGSGTSRPPMPAAQMGPNLTPDLIKSAQQRLRHDGFYHARIDGIAGPQTERAVFEFQQKQGLPETGRLDGPTLNKMNLHPQQSELRSSEHA